MIRKRKGPGAVGGAGAQKGFQKEPSTNSQTAQQPQARPVFIVSLCRWRGEPTPKQCEWLNDIVGRLRGNQ